MVPTSMTLNDLERRNSLYFAFFTEFDRFSCRLYITVIEDNVCKILSPSSSLLLLAKTITHPAAHSLCDSWASCKYYCLFDVTRVRITIYQHATVWNVLCCVVAFNMKRKCFVCDWEGLVIAVIIGVVVGSVCGFLLLALVLSCRR